LKAIAEAKKIELELKAANSALSSAKQEVEKLRSRLDFENKEVILARCRRFEEILTGQQDKKEKLEARYKQLSKDYYALKEFCERQVEAIKELQAKQQSRGDTNNANATVSTDVLAQMEELRARLVKTTTELKTATLAKEATQKACDMAKLEAERNSASARDTASSRLPPILLPHLSFH
jgi:chromosome segregation ATPase